MTTAAVTMISPLARPRDCPLIAGTDDGCSDRVCDGLLAAQCITVRRIGGFACHGFVGFRQPVEQDLLCAFDRIGGVGGDEFVAECPRDGGPITIFFVAAVIPAGSLWDLGVANVGENVTAVACGRDVPNTWQFFAGVLRRAPGEVVGGIVSR